MPSSIVKEWSVTKMAESNEWVKPHESNNAASQEGLRSVSDNVTLNVPNFVSYCVNSGHHYYWHNKNLKNRIGVANRWWNRNKSRMIGGNFWKFPKVIGEIKSIMGSDLKSTHSSWLQGCTGKAGFRLAVGCNRP